MAARPSSIVLIRDVYHAAESKNGVPRTFVRWLTKEVDEPDHPGKGQTLGEALIAILDRYYDAAECRCADCNARTRKLVWRDKRSAMRHDVTKAVADYTTF